MKGDIASIRQNAIPSLAADFGGIEATVKSHEQNLAASQATVKAGLSPQCHGHLAEPAHRILLWCVRQERPNSGQRGLLFRQSCHRANTQLCFSTPASPQRSNNVFGGASNRSGPDWKVGDLYVKSAQVAGHDSDWFLARARDYKAKGQAHNSWLYFEQSLDLASRGMRFMSTLTTDRLYDEKQTVQPSDLPANGKAVDLVARTTTYKLSAVFPWMIGND